MKRNKVAIVVATVIFSVICMVGCAKKDTQTDLNFTIKAISEISDVGDYVTFGHYEQDGDESNGSEPIVWEVLEIEENRALLISKYVLDVKPYDGTTWENCSLRNWLNNEFLNTAFDEAEQLQIPTVKLINPDNSVEEEVLGVIEGGNDTQDKAFVLSVRDIFKYYSFDDWNQSTGYYHVLITDATNYARANGVKTGKITKKDYNNYFKEMNYPSDVIGCQGTYYWLRSPGPVGACIVTSTGSAGWECSYMSDCEVIGVRPALYVEW